MRFKFLELNECDNFNTCFDNQYFEVDIVLRTDASDLAIDVVLMQKIHVLAYEYCKLNYVELNYSVHEKELFVVVHALET